MYVKCDVSQFSLEELSERLKVMVFDREATLAEKLSFPSSIQEEENKSGILLKIKPDFNLENEEFGRFLKEAYNSFVEKQKY